MRRSSDPEVRRKAAATTTIESLDESAAQDAVTVTQDGVQQIVANGGGHLMKSMQSLHEASTASVDEGPQETVELTPLHGGSVGGGGSTVSLRASESMVSLPKSRVRYPTL